MTHVVLGDGESFQKERGIEGIHSIYRRLHPCKEENVEKERGSKQNRRLCEGGRFLYTHDG